MGLLTEQKPEEVSSEGMVQRPLFATKAFVAEVSVIG
jgi:hypothetical protein